MTNTMVTNISFGVALLLVIAAGYLKVLPTDLIAPAFTSILGAWVGLQIPSPIQNTQIKQLTEGVANATTTTSPPAERNPA